MPTTTQSARPIGAPATNPAPHLRLVGNDEQDTNTQFAGLYGDFDHEEAARIDALSVSISMSRIPDLLESRAKPDADGLAELFVLADRNFPGLPDPEIVPMDEALTTVRDMIESALTSRAFEAWSDGQRRQFFRGALTMVSSLGLARGLGRECFGCGHLCKPGDGPDGVCYEYCELCTVILCAESAAAEADADACDGWVPDRDVVDAAEAADRLAAQSRLADSAVRDRIDQSKEPF